MFYIILVDYILKTFPPENSIQLCIPTYEKIKSSMIYTAQLNETKRFHYNLHAYMQV